MPNFELHYDYSGDALVFVDASNSALDFLKKITNVDDPSENTDPIVNGANITKIKQYLDNLPEAINTEFNTAKTEITGNIDQKLDAFKLSLNNTFLSPEAVNQQFKYISKDLDKKSAVL